MVHPQFWPEDLEYAGKRVVIIGSGATAVTLVPAMAETAAHVTMLQRSPSWIGAIPGKDAHRRQAPRRCCRRGSRTGSSGPRTSPSSWRSTTSARRFPSRARKVLTGMNAKILGDPAMVAEHFTPTYDPWDQRFCAVPDADLFTRDQAR